MELWDAQTILSQSAKFKDAQINVMETECAWVEDAYVTLIFRVLPARSYLF